MPAERKGRDDTEVETPAEEKGEQDEAVKVPEEFQKAAYELVEDANTHELSFLRTCISDREQEMMKADREEMNTEGMPTD